MLSFTVHHECRGSGIDKEREVTTRMGVGLLCGQVSPQPPTVACGRPPDLSRVTQLRFRRKLSRLSSK